MSKIARACLVAAGLRLDAKALREAGLHEKAKEMLHTANQRGYFEHEVYYRIMEIKMRRYNEARRLLLEAKK